MISLKTMCRPLHAKFGLVLDSWASGGRHFVAIFAVYCDITGQIGSSTGFGIDKSSKTGFRAGHAHTGSSTGPDLDGEMFEDAERSDRSFLLLAFRPF